MPAATKLPYVNSGSMARGDTYDPIQLCKRYPQLAFLYHPFEREYDPEPVLNWMKQNEYVLPLAAVGLYIVFVFVIGPLVMKGRTKGFALNSAFAYWNLFLSLFSFYGVSRTVPHLVYRVMNESFEDTVCKSAHVAYGGGTAGLAIQIFVLSKIPELLDTVFLILLKKEVIFLHWYHHITVLLYCWNSYVTESAAGLWFAAMNYSVHAVMYMYFYLQSAFPTPKGSKSFLKTILSTIAPFITSMQIMQMFCGTAIVLSCVYFGLYGTKDYNKGYKFPPPNPNPANCGNTFSNLVAGGLMYASYFALFVAFAFRRFVLKKDDFSKKEGGKKAN